MELNLTEDDVRKGTLSRKILLRSVALVAALLLLGVASLLSVASLSRQVRNATLEYAELRQIETISINTANAIGLLRASPPDLTTAAQELRQAIVSMQHFAMIQQHESEGSARHEAQESRTIHETLAVLQQVCADVSQPAGGSDWSSQTSALAGVQAELGDLADDADALIAKLQERTRRGVWNAAAAIGAGFGLIAIVAVVISIGQYRGIMRPLRAMRDGVRRIASGQFQQRLPAVGEREFVELTEDFNRMAAELQELYRDLEAKVAAKSRELVKAERLASVGFLAAGVAHEINNPLGIMSGFAELSLKKLRQGTGNSTAAIDDARRSLQIIRDEAFRCRDITEKLLTMARGSNGIRGAVPLAGVVEDVAAMIAAHQAYRGRRVEIALNDEDLTVFGDEAEIRQVLLNLCVNAQGAVDPLTGVVRIVARRVNHDTEVDVEDNGCGMPPHVLQHLFEPFFSARRGEARGTGLGLSITRAIMERLGGTIHADSAGPGRGSTFTLRFPGVAMESVEA